jgi:predicted DNA-binding transcriptional regulator AlpA
MVDLDELVDAVEIAHRTGVARPQVVYDWRRRHEAFPKPITRIGNLHIWLWPEVEEWAKSTGRLERNDVTG